MLSLVNRERQACSADWIGEGIMRNRNSFLATSLQLGQRHDQIDRQCSRLRDRVLTGGKGEYKRSSSGFYPFICRDCFAG